MSCSSRLVCPTTERSEHIDFLGIPYRIGERQAVIEWDMAIILAFTASRTFKFSSLVSIESIGYQLSTLG